MSIHFPSSADVFPDAATLAGHQLGTDPHSTLHGDLGDAVNAVEVWLLAALAPGAFKLTLAANATLSGTNTGDQDLSGYLTTSTAASTYQPVDADLTALAALSGTGLVTRVTSNTFTTRAITGTTDVITVTDGDGVVGNPIITISPTYVGQTSITTLGTISTGTWAGTTIAVNHGGWGLATLTLHALYVGNGTSAPTALGLGTLGQVLTSNGASADPSWGSASGRVVYASRVGAALDTNLSSGGGTDDTAVLQAVLDTALSTLPLTLVIDGPALVTGLRVKSYTRVVFPPGCGLFLKAASDKALLTNYNRALFGSRQDTQIEVWGGYLNGNRANQTADQESDGTIVVGVAFLGVTDCLVRDTHIVGPKNWGMVFSAASHVLVENYRMERVGTGIQQDGINLRGPCDHVVIRRCWIQSYDDAIALNSRDYSAQVSPYPLGPFIAGGDITDVSIDDICLDDALFGIDLISDQYVIDRVTIRNVYGTCRNHALSLNYDTFNSGNVGTGAIGSITFDGLDVQQTGTPYGAPFKGTVFVNATINSLVFRNLRLSDPINNSFPLVYVAAAGNVTTGLQVSGVNIHDEAGVTSGHVVMLDSGSVRDLAVSDVEWYRGASATQSGDVVNLNSSSGGATVVRVCGVHMRRAGSAVDLNAGDCPRVMVCDVDMEACNSSGAAYYVNPSSSVTTQLTVSNFRGVAKVAGNGAALVTDRSGDIFIDATAPLAYAETAISSATTIATFGTTYRCSGTSANYIVTLPAASSGNKDKSLRVVVDPNMTKLVWVTGASTVTDVNSRTSSWSLTGLFVGANTNQLVIASDQVKIYFTVTVSGGNNVVNVYRESAGSNLIATGTIATASLSGTPATVTLAASNNSGISGTVGLVSGTADSTASQNFVAYDTIDGQPQRCLWANETAALRCVLLASGNYAWHKDGGLTIPMACRMHLSANSSALANQTFTNVAVNVVNLDNTGLMADTTNKRINIQRPAPYTIGGAIAWASTGAGGTFNNNCLSLLGSIQLSATDGTSNRVAQGITPGLSGGLAHTNFVDTTLPVSAGNYLVMNGYKDSADTNIVFTGGTGVACSMFAIEVPQW